MKLIVKCTKCREENKVPYFVDNRVDYAKEYGENFTLKCKRCNEVSTYHVDDIKAVDYNFSEIIKNRLMVFAVIYVVALVLGYFLTGITGGFIIALLLVFISVVLAKRNNSAKNLVFNKHKLKGRVTNVAFRK